MAGDTTLSIDVDALSIGDLEDFEEHTGLVFMEVVKGQDISKLPMKALKVLIWIVKRHEDPDFTLEDARNIKIAMIDVPQEGGDGNRPLKAAG